jgi:hypothetical protein
MKADRLPTLFRRARQQRLPTTETASLDFFLAAIPPNSMSAGLQALVTWQRRASWGLVFAIMALAVCATFQWLAPASDPTAQQIASLLIPLDMPPP